MSSPFTCDGQRLVWSTEHETLWLEPWGTDALRVRCFLEPTAPDKPSALLDAQPTDSTIAIEEQGATIRNGRIVAMISRGGHVRFVDAVDDRLLVEEMPVQPLHPRPRQLRSVGGRLYHAQTCFRAQVGERFYGLGQHRHGRLDQKGSVIDLVQRNCEVAIPLLVSSWGYALLWNNPAIGRVELGHTQTRWVAEATTQIDYWIAGGDSYDALMERYGEATGRAPMLPAWASGFWQSKLRYRTQDEVLAVAREHRRRGLPLSVIVIDYFHWPVMGDFCFDPQAFPDPAAMVRELDEMDVNLMVSVWPSVNTASRNFHQMKRRGLLLRTERGVPALFPFVDTPDLRRLTYIHYYDPTHPQACAFIWEKIRENYHKHGIRIFWLDACEPEMDPIDPDNLRYHAGNGLEVGCIYPIAHQQAFYDGLHAEGEKEILTLCRSAWAGSQRYGAAVWSGDIDSTFASLAAQVRAGMNMGLSGIPWWTTDIGGFLHGDPQSPEFRELIVRWFQFGVFCPLFRLHGYRQPITPETGGPNEVWSFGDVAYGIIRDLMLLRERLRPYVMQLMRAAHERGTPLMRPLFFDFDRDPKTADVDDQYMFGPDLLVAPVLEAGATSRRVYLPAGTHWRDAWTGQTHDGGKTIDVDAPLDRIPLFLRADASLPISDAASA